MFRHSWSVYAIDITNDLFKFAIKFCQIKTTARSTSSEIKIGEIDNWVIVFCTILLSIACKKKKTKFDRTIKLAIILYYHWIFFSFFTYMSISRHVFTNSNIRNPNFEISPFLDYTFKTYWANDNFWLTIWFARNNDNHSKNQNRIKSINDCNQELLMKTWVVIPFLNHPVFSSPI